jgi:hypothetical protein
MGGRAIKIEIPTPPTPKSSFKHITHTKMLSTLSYWNPVLKNHTEVKWVIVFKSGIEGYLTMEDALGDLEYQESLHGSGVVYKVTAPEKMVAVYCREPMD